MFFAVFLVEGIRSLGERVCHYGDGMEAMEGGILGAFVGDVADR